MNIDQQLLQPDLLTLDGLNFIALSVFTLLSIGDSAIVEFARNSLPHVAESRRFIVIMAIKEYLTLGIGSIYEMGEYQV